VTRRWSLWGAACLLAVSAVLGGCSERQEASDTLPSASAEPTESAPELAPLGPPDLPMPDEARTPDAAGAEAFVRYYIELINRTSDVMDAAPLREFSNGCEDCERIAADAESDAASGFRYKGGRLSITRFGSPLVEGNTAQVAFRVHLTALIVVDSAGNPVPNLSFQEFPDLSSGASVEWDVQEKVWTMTQLTLG
jgi:Family of unknown function (DUF6318)